METIFGITVGTDRKNDLQGRIDLPKSPQCLSEYLLRPLHVQLLFRKPRPGLLMAIRNHPPVLIQTVITVRT